MSDANPEAKRAWARLPEASCLRSRRNLHRLPALRESSLEFTTKIRQGRAKESSFFSWSGDSRRRNIALPERSTGLEQIFAHW